MLIGCQERLMHERFMRVALAEAKKALVQNEVPVGAVVVRDNKVIARGHNRRESWHDPTAHAEVLALREAGSAVNDWRLTDTTLYVTLEPCSMCSGAILQARINKLVFGAFDERAGAVGSTLDIIRSGIFPNNIEVVGGVLATPCQDILKQFFNSKRE